MNTVKGGGFLLSPTPLDGVFIPEDMANLHKIVRNTIRDFCPDRVMNQFTEIEERKEGVMLSLIREVGELGLLGRDIPKEYGGEENDKVTSIILSENTTYNNSFAVIFGGQVGIGILPILYFGNEEQKEKYMPGLVS